MNLAGMTRELERQRRERYAKAAEIATTMVLSVHEVAERLAAGDTEDEIRTDVDVMMRLGYSASTLPPHRIAARLARATSSVRG